MNAFAAVLGVHVGITYANSRMAIATSLGTLLFSQGKYDEAERL